MIIKNEQMHNEEKTNMRGGNGTVNIRHLVPTEEVTHGRLLAEISIPQGASIGEHTHSDETEYYIIHSGNGIVVDNGVETAVSAGDVVVTKDGASHSIANTGNTPLIMTAVIIFC